MKSLVAIFAALVVFVAATIFVVTAMNAPRATFHLVSSSDHARMDTLLQNWADANRIELIISYRDDENVTQWLSDEPTANAVWPRSEFWMQFEGDAEALGLTYRSPVLNTPVVFALKRSIAEELKWTGNVSVSVQDILAAAEKDAFRLSLPSPSHDSVGAMAYLGLLHALSDSKGTLDLKNLMAAETLDPILTLLHEVDQSAGSSLWLVEEASRDASMIEALFMTEADLIEMNKDLRLAEKPTFYAIYPDQAVTLLESPLSYVDAGDGEIEKVFLELQAFLESDTAKKSLVNFGWRTWADLTGADKEIWNAGWGLDPDRALSAVPLPQKDVIEIALDLYQEELRKPSLKVWLVDLTATQNVGALQEVKNGLASVLDSEMSSIARLSPTARDVTLILPLGDGPLDPILLEGADPTSRARTLRFVNDMTIEGGEMDLYYGLFEGYDAMTPYHNHDTLSRFLPSIVLLTQGFTSSETREALLAHRDLLPFAKDVPIHTLVYGNAYGTQIREMSELTGGRVILTQDNIADAVRAFAGYN